MLIEEVLRPLLEIIYLYKESNYYNYVPGTEEDSDAGWKYFEKRFRDIYCGLNQNLYISQEVYLKVHKIIEEIQTFVRMFSGADGLSERYFEINPNLLCINPKTQPLRYQYGTQRHILSAYHLL